ncbi:MAG: hypothetical protein ABI594_15005, partial [Ginsengibacter sp.]
MNKLFIIFLILSGFTDQALSQERISEPLPVWKPASENLYKTDWLVYPVTEKAQAYTSADGKDITLFNGLVKRTF